MSLQAYYDSLPPDQQALQFGLAGVDPLGHAFPRKRVVHAGLHGQLIAPAESQQIWQDIMSGKDGYLVCQRRQPRLPRRPVL